MQGRNLAGRQDINEDPETSEFGSSDVQTRRIPQQDLRNSSRKLGSQKNHFLQNLKPKFDTSKQRIIVVALTLELPLHWGVSCITSSIGSRIAVALIGKGSRKLHATWLDIVLDLLSRLIADIITTLVADVAIDIAANINNR